MVQKKTGAKEGYEALQVGFDRRSLAKCNKPEKGHFEKHGAKSGFKYLQEIRLERPKATWQRARRSPWSNLRSAISVDVIGTSKGRGFAGSIKRWNFHRGPMSHGSMSHRAPGSIGAAPIPPGSSEARRCRARWETPG